MSRLKRSPSSSSAAMYAALLGFVLWGCGAREQPPAPGAAGPVGTFRAELKVATDDPTIQGVHFVVAPASKNDVGVPHETTLPLLQGGPGAARPDLANARFADWLLVLPVGRYAVSAIPVGGDGKPTAGCSKAETQVNVLPEMTSEVKLVSNCAGKPTGGLDTTVVVNRIPSITGLETGTGKFLCQDEPFVAELKAQDENPAALAWQFKVSKRPEGANEDAYCLAHKGGKVSFSAVTPGAYELTAEVSDGHGSARVTFPVYIEQCGRAVCPGLGALASLGVPPDGAVGLCTCELPKLTVSPNVKPVKPTVSGVTKGEPDRPVARLVAGKGGAVVDFVADELLVMSNDPAAVEDMRLRWNGQIVGGIDPSLLEGAVAPMFTKYYRMRIDLSRADLTNLPQKWARASGAAGEHAFSSDLGVRLLAAALAEANLDPAIKVSLNPLMKSDDFVSRSTNEDENGPGEFWDRDAYRWPYMDRASEQDIGTAEAWTFLHGLGRLGNVVRMGIADGGFILNNDFPVSVMAGPEHVQNPSSCGGEPCPWHGTMVALAAAGVPNNNIGVAGPAGPVANLTLLPSPAEDFFAYMQYIFANIPMALSTRPHIINISASVDLPSEACLFAALGAPVCEVLNGITATFRGAGVLIFAAAGNDGADVDRMSTFSEHAIRIPCELEGVICVGGLAHNSNNRDGASAYGSTPDHPGSVDIFGPFSVYVIEDPLAADRDNPTPDTHVALKHGTSFASPYVAGVAALIWAANPSLSAAQVERILLDTAHTNSADRRVHRWVNALAGVMTAAGFDTPPFLRLAGATLDVPQGSSVALTGDVEELQNQGVTVEWRRAGAIVATTVVPRTTPLKARAVLDTTGWPLGANVIEAQATDSRGNRSAVDRVTVNVVPVTTPPALESLTGLHTGRLCPRGPDRGDAEFNGGPEIRVDVRLEISGDRRQILAQVNYRADEVGGDRTQLREAFTVPVHTVAEGQSILRIASEDTFTHTLVGPGGGFHWEAFGCEPGPEVHATFTSGLVGELRVVGDTPNTDMSFDGSNCGCNGRINDIVFRPLQIEIAR